MESDEVGMKMEAIMESVADGMKEKAIKNNAAVVSRGVCSQ